MLGRCTNRGRKVGARFNKKTGEPYEPRLGEVLRQERAAERAAVRDERGPYAQLAELDRRLGKGVGAKRERERLRKAMVKLGTSAVGTVLREKKVVV